MRVGCSQLAQIRAKSVAGCDSTSSRVCRCLRVVKGLGVRSMAKKLLRACGGCLGTKRRRRTWRTAICNGELYASD